MIVQTTTEEYPPLAEHVALRQLRGLDAFDEWWDGVYRIVNEPPPEHIDVLDALVELIEPLAQAVGLEGAAPIKVGSHMQNFRVPDWTISEPNTPVIAVPGFRASALQVVEVLAPNEKSKAKLDFYHHHDVVEYLEIDLTRSQVQLLRRFDSSTGLAGWQEIYESQVLPDLSVKAVARRLRDGGEVSAGRVIVTPHGELNVGDYRV